MKNFFVDANGVIVIDDSNDAIFVPKTYFAGFKAALELVGKPEVLGSSKFVGILDISYTDNGIHMTDGSEGVFIGIDQIPDLIEGMGL